MRNTIHRSLLTAALTASLLPVAAKAQVIISEVDPNGSASGSGYGADWFELKNIGNTAVDITGWKMDDNSDLFANAVPLRGITSIAAGQSVVFIEGGTTSAGDAALDTLFENTWFSAGVPSGFTVANYGGSGVGLGSGGDAVNIFDSAGTAITGVTFGATTLGATLDNTAGLSGPISQSSVVGVNGAFSDGTEIGSPDDVAVAPVPEPSTLALAGAGLAGLWALRRRVQK